MLISNFVNINYFSHINNQTNKISINHKPMCSSKREGDSDEEIKLVTKQIEWWPSFTQPNFSCRQWPPRAIVVWLSLSLSLSLSLTHTSFSLLSLILSQAQPCRNLRSTATIHGSTRQRGLHHWWRPLSLSLSVLSFGWFGD